MSSSAPKKFDFSIESLLRDGPVRKNIVFGEKLSTREFDLSNDKRISNADLGNLSSSPIVIDGDGQGCRNNGEDDEEGLKVSVDEEEESVHDSQTFSWLHCTRFKPPKLPRSKKRGNMNKRLGRGPRIPFSPHQIAVLENTFCNSQYLSGDCINRLADALHLSDTRVKIWFQNRRARYRREKDGMGLDKTGVSGSDHGTVAIAKPYNSNSKAVLHSMHHSSTPIIRKYHDNNYSASVDKTVEECKAIKSFSRRHEATKLCHNHQGQEEGCNAVPFSSGSSLQPQKLIDISSRSSTNSVNSKSLAEAASFEAAEVQFHLGHFQVGSFADLKYFGERMKGMDLCSLVGVPFPDAYIHALPSRHDDGGNVGAYRGFYEPYCKHNVEGCGINPFNFSNEGSQQKDLEMLRIGHMSYSPFIRTGTADEVKRNCNL